MSGAIRAVVFDLGGVLIDLWNGPALSAVAGVVGVSKPEIATVYRSLEEPISTGALSVADALERLLQTAGGDRFPEPRRGRAVRLIQATLGNRFTPNGPVIELSYALASRGVTVAVGSNTNPLDIAALRRQFPDLFVPFEGRVFASHEIGAMKPARAFYAAVSAGLKLDPGVCVFIDDRGENVAAARQFGMHAIRYTGTDELTEELAD